jgi:hypothetical protein
MFIDTNSLNPANAMSLEVIATDTNTDGEVIDTQGIRDVNFLTKILALVSGDIEFQIRTADDVGMSVNLETIAADKVNGNLYAETILNATLAVDQYFHHHIQRTSHRRFVQLRVVSSNTASYTLDSTAAMGTLSRSVSKDKNPVA